MSYDYSTYKAKAQRVFTEMLDKCIKEFPKASDLSVDQELHFSGPFIHGNFASGCCEPVENMPFTYKITLSQIWLIDQEKVKGIIAHELTHAICKTHLHDAKFKKTLKALNDFFGIKPALNRTEVNEMLADLYAIDQESFSVVRNHLQASVDKKKKKFPGYKSPYVFPGE